jgi:hypothetical protein
MSKQDNINISTFEKLWDVVLKAWTQNPLQYQAIKTSIIEILEKHNEEMEKTK